MWPKTRRGGKRRGSRQTLCKLCRVAAPIITTLRKHFPTIRLSVTTFTEQERMSSHQPKVTHPWPVIPAPVPSSDPQHTQAHHYHHKHRHPTGKDTKPYCYGTRTPPSLQRVPLLTSNRISSNLLNTPNKAVALRKAGLQLFRIVAWLLTLSTALLLFETITHPSRMSFNSSSVLP